MLDVDPALVNLGGVVIPTAANYQLQRSVQECAVKGEKERHSMTRILRDVQLALFRLDEIQSTTRSNGTTEIARSISNFKRLVCVRDLAKEYTKAGELENGVSMFEFAIQRAESPEKSSCPYRVGYSIA